MSSLLTPKRFFAGYIIDLDGTVNLEEAMLPTADETLTVLRARGVHTIFISNNSTHGRKSTPSNSPGVPTSIEDTLTSSIMMMELWYL